MATIEEVNKAFVENGLSIQLPLPGGWFVKNIDVLEKHRYPGGIRVLLGVRYIDDRGREISDLFLCEGGITRPKRAADSRSSNIWEPLKSVFLPLRNKTMFANEDEAKDYLREAMGHLLQDKGYSPVEQNEVDLYFCKGELRFFLNLSPRCDEEALEKTDQLIVLRNKNGAVHDYGLAIPAFQESLGIPLRVQERWVSSRMDYLASNRIGIYAVNNTDPNQIYAFTTYPKSQALMKYFVSTAPQWWLIRGRYVANRE